MPYFLTKWPPTPRKMAVGMNTIALSNIRQIFRRFRKDIQNHEIILFAGLVKSTNTWYYYNMADDKEGWKEVELREAKIALGYDRALCEDRRNIKNVR